MGTQAHMQIFHQNRVVIDPRIHTKYQTGFNCLGWNYPPPPPRLFLKKKRGKEKKKGEKEINGKKIKFLI